IVFAGAAIMIWRPWTHAAAQPVADIRFDTNAFTVLIRSGLNASQPGTYKGRIAGVSSDAKVLGISGYHFQADDSAAASGEFAFATRTWGAPFVHVDLSPVRPGPRTIFPNGVYARLTGDRFRADLNGESIAFSRRNLPRTVAGGDIEVSLVPTALALSEGSGNDDYPAIAATPDGNVAIVYQEYSGSADRLIIREMRNGVFRYETIEAPETRDVFRPALVYDSTGALHVVWSAQIDGEWKLYARHRIA